jgi:tRNA A-37 threonylcarbamoyl transferase component Bud32
MLSEPIGSYNVLRKIGAGGMGTVYEAVQPVTGRHAAVKVVRPVWTRDRDRITRFLLEARSAGAIPHPGIASIYDSGLTGDRSAYLVMELLRGETLSRRRIRAGGRLGAQAVCFGRQIAGALAAAHARGIVHRDLRSHNVMIVPDPRTSGGERCKILDFGLAQLGDPAECADAAVDVYGLGRMMVELLAGVPPLWPRRLGKLLPPPDRAPARALRSIVPDVPAALDTLVSRMLAPSAEARPTMLDVAQELAALEGVRVFPGGKYREQDDDAVPAALGWGRWPAVVARGREAGASAAGIAVVSQTPRVRVTVRSFPSGAEVVRASDNAVLGLTPFTRESDRGEGTLDVVVRLRGFEPRAIAIDLRRDRDELVRLRARA